MNRSWTQRRPIALAMLVGLTLSLSGCTGRGIQPSSWTGLTVVEETVYAADLEQVRALEAADGQALWRFPDDPEESNHGAFYVTPVVGEGRVFVASEVTTGGFLSQRENIVWALDADTGRELWRFEGASGQYIEGGALGGGVLVIGNGDGNVYALDTDSGSLKWAFETGHHVWATPLIVSDTVYVGSMDRHLYALRLADGEVRWDFHTEGAFASAPALEGGALYIGAFDDTFYAVDAHTGVERWRFKGENWFWGRPAVRGDVVYATDVNGNVYALDAESGEQVWSKGLDAPVRAGPALSEDGSRVLVGAENGTLYALDTADGVLVWLSPSEGRVLSTPAVIDSVVYETLIYGTHRIRALHVANGREIWAYARVEEEE